MKAISKRIIAMLSVICMATCFIPVMTGIAYADSNDKTDILPDTEPVSMSIGGTVENEAVNETASNVKAAQEAIAEDVAKVGGSGDAVCVGGVISQGGYIKGKNIKGTVYYDADNNALYLEKATITAARIPESPSYDKYGILATSSDTLVIYILGTNTIKGTPIADTKIYSYDSIYGIGATSNVTIVPKTNKKATLKISLTKKANVSMGIICDGLAVLRNAAVTATASDAVFNSIGVVAYEVVVADSASLTANGKLANNTIDYDYPDSGGLMVEGDVIVQEKATLKGTSKEGSDEGCSAGAYIMGNLELDGTATFDSTAAKSGKTKFTMGLIIDGEVENAGSLTAKGGKASLSAAGLRLNNNMHTVGVLLATSAGGMAIVQAYGHNMYWYDLYVMKAGTNSTGKKAAYWTNPMTDDTSYLKYIKVEKVKASVSDVEWNAEDAAWGLYPAVSAKIGKKSVAYELNVPTVASNIGLYDAILYGDCDYSKPSTLGIKYFEFEVYPTRPVLTGYESGSTYIGVDYNPAVNNNEGNLRYEFRVSKSSSMKSPKYYSTEETWYAGALLDDLKPATTYYIQMRTVGDSYSSYQGEWIEHYSPWSKTLKCKTKK